MHTSTTQVAATKLVLTRKGKLAAAVLFMILIGLLIALAWSRPGIPPAVATTDGSASYQQIVVQPGDTLWTIASRVSQGADHSVVLDQIVTYNDLDTSDLQIGQALYVPVHHN